MKKIFYSLILFLSLFIFSSNVDALECLYEAKDGDRIVVYQFDGGFMTGWTAYADPFGSIEVDGVTVKDSDYTTKVYNDIEWIDEWKKTDSCFEKLMYNESVGADEVYVCDNWDDCGSGDKKFYLKEPYSQSPENVGLNEMVCTYAAQNTEGFIYKYSFVINLKDSETMTGSYSLWENYEKLYDSDFEKDGINTTITYPASGQYQSKKYFDSFTIRTFWNEKTGHFQCPGEIAVTSECEINALLGSSDCAYYIGYSDTSNSEFQSSGGFLWSQITSKKFDVYKLAQNASFIDYDSSVTDDEICVFTYENLVCNPEEDYCNPEVKLNLIQRKYQNGKTEFLAAVNSNYTDYSEKTITTNLNLTQITSCDDIKELYTDCLNTSGSNCTVSTEPGANQEKLVPNVWSNTQDVEDVIEGMSSVNGLKYKRLICELSGRLNAYVDKNVVNTLPKLDFYDSYGFHENLAINNLNCTNWGYSSKYNCNTDECKEQLGYSLELKILETREYCNDMFDRYVNRLDTTMYQDRKTECITFNRFYNDLVSKGIIVDQTQGCDFISPELEAKLIFVLDLLKIAGPILALGLGTLDFIKVLLSGDADKEMKTAFRKFSIRIVAAILLFIIPLVLAFLMDTFIGSQDGYDSDNPFCAVVDWEE